MNLPAMHTLRVPIGDWSDDGHGKCDVYVIKSNYPKEALQDAYLASCALTGYKFHASHSDYHIPNVSEGVKRATPLLAKYRETCLPESATVKFQSLGCPEDFLEMDDGVMDLLLWFIGLSMPKDWECQIVKDDSPQLWGFWDKRLNFQVGYGLFE